MPRMQGIVPGVGSRTNTDRHFEIEITFVNVPIPYKKYVTYGDLIDSVYNSQFDFGVID